MKAFDTVNHKVLWSVLKSYGVDYKLITVLKKIYGKAQSAIRINKENGEWFHTSVRTRQGDPLSPLLSITYLEGIMEKVIQNPCGININGNLINNLRFADDITVFSVLLYASETWTLRESDKRKLLAFRMRCYRQILKIKWTDKISNEAIRKMMSRKIIIVDIIKKRKLQLFGHICRMDDSWLVKQVAFSRMNGKSRIGRPSREWLDDIIAWCQCNIEDLFHLAQNRKGRKDLILSSIGPDGR